MNSTERFDAIAPRIAWWKTLISIVGGVVMAPVTAVVVVLVVASSVPMLVFAPVLLVYLLRPTKVPPLSLPPRRMVTAPSPA